jgi:hypothetical protein
MSPKNRGGAERASVVAARNKGSDDMIENLQSDAGSGSDDFANFP